MSRRISRLTLLCRQSLAIGAVTAVAVPAAAVGTLDIVPPAQVEPVRAATPVERAGTATRATGALVAAAPVRPTVTETPVRGVEPAGLAALGPSRATGRTGWGGLSALSAPEPVTGYATVGVTWREAQDIRPGGLAVYLRSRQSGAWSGWEQMEYDAGHGPDSNTAEVTSRTGTDPVVVGAVDRVQVKVVTSGGEPPAGLRVAVVDPGPTVAPRRQAPAIDPGARAQGGYPAERGSEAAARGALTAGTPAAVTPAPAIYSRAQWGADERMRDSTSPDYGQVQAGFVHHTVNANGYTREQVPALLRGIYAYHTQSLGWSDIGYNYVVDRFGRIWEGRYGGVSRPVVGAHTLGYNDYSFAMSALGNFETAQPSAQMLDAYARLFAWKLSLHGVDPTSMRQRVGGSTFPAISGHRDAGQTACPGRYLYAQLPTIRAMAARYQQSFASRDRMTNLAGSSWPDFVVRDPKSRKALLVKTGGQLAFDSGVPATGRWGGMDLLAAGGDLTGDGLPDLLARASSTKLTAIYPGDGTGGFGGPIGATSKFSGADQLSVAGDLDGDGINDVVARSAATQRLYLYPGDGRGGLGRRVLLASDWGRYNLTAGVGDLSGDGRDDLVARDGAGVLWLLRGGSRGLSAPAALPGRWGAMDLIAGLGDVTRDGRPDIVARNGRSKLTFVYPGNGQGGLGYRMGPLPGFANLDFLAIGGRLAGTRPADLVGRDGQGRLLVFPNTGRRNLAGIVDTGTVLPSADLVLNVGDWNGDGRGDVMTRSASTGRMLLRAGDGQGGLAAPVVAGTGWGTVRLVAAVGDITGDGFPDLMGQPAGSSMRIYPGDGSTGFQPSYPAGTAVTGSDQLGVGLWNRDGSPDTAVRRRNGSLLLFPGNGPGGLMAPVRIATGMARYDWLSGIGDATGDGRPDVLARARATGRLWLLPGTADGGFDRRWFLADGFGRFDLSS